MTENRMNKKQLKAWRTKKSITQSQAAKAFDVGLGAYQRWEWGKMDVPFLVAEKIRLCDELETLQSRYDLLLKELDGKA